MWDQAASMLVGVCSDSKFLGIGICDSNSNFEESRILRSSEFGIFNSIWGFDLNSIQATTNPKSLKQAWRKKQNKIGNLQR